MVLVSTHLYNHTLRCNSKNSRFHLLLRSVLESKIARRLFLPASPMASYVYQDVATGEALSSLGLLAAESIGKSTVMLQTRDEQLMQVATIICLP